MGPLHEYATSPPAPQPGREASIEQENCSLLRCKPRAARRVPCETRAVALRAPANSAKRPLPMANRAIWNVRKRHEWLSTPLKGKRLNKRKRLRVGLEQARERAKGSETSAAS